MPRLDAFVHGFTHCTRKWNDTDNDSPNWEKAGKVAAYALLGIPAGIQACRKRWQTRNNNQPQWWGKIEQTTQTESKFEKREKAIKSLIGIVRANATKKDFSVTSGLVALFAHSPTPVHPAHTDLKVS